MRKSKILLTATMCCTMLFSVGCSKEKKTDYNKYVSLGQYKGIEVTLDSTEVTDEEVTEEINARLEAKASYQDVTDRAVKKDDKVNIDYEGKVDGEKFEGGSAEKFDLVIGSGRFIDDFEDQLIGHKIGETVEVNVTFPEEYSQNEDLQNKDAVFTVKINGIKENVVPKLDEKWVTENSESSKTVKEYKDEVRATLVAQKEATQAKNKTADVLTAIVENSEITGYPKDEIDAYIADMKSYYELLASQYGTNFETMISMMGMTVESFEKEANTLAEATIARQMVCRVIAEKENMKVTDEEYKEALEQYAADYSTEQKEYTAKTFEDEYGKDKITENILLEKVLDFITDNAVVVE